MVARKRARREMEEETAEEVVASEPTLLQRIRSMWEFASLVQFFFLFGKAVKVDDMEVEVRQDNFMGSTEDKELTNVC